MRCLIGKSPYYLGNILVLALMFWFLITVRLTWDLWIVETPTAWSRTKYMWMVYGYTFVPMLAAFSQFPVRAILATNRWLIIVGTFIGPATLFLTLGGGRGSSLYRLQSELLNSISLGHIGASCVLIALVSFFSPHVSKTLKAPCIIMGAFGIVMATLASARGPLLSLAIVIILWLSVNTSSWRNRLLAIFTALIVLLTIYSFSLRTERTTDYRPLARLEDTDISRGSEGEARVYLVSRALAVFSDDPLFGGALVEPESRSYPHNVIVESLMSLGVLGTALFITIIVIWCIAAVKAIKENNRLVWLAVLFIQYLVGSMFSGSLYTNVFIWVMGCHLCVNYIFSKRLARTVVA